MPGGLSCAARCYSPNDASEGGRWLLLHGWLDNSDSFAQLAPKLCDADGAAFADVEALALAGHGLSDHRNGPYHAVDFAADAIYAANELWGEGCHFNVTALSRRRRADGRRRVAGPHTTRGSDRKRPGARRAAADAPSSLAEELPQAPCRRLAARLFKDAADAAQRRAQKCDGRRAIHGNALALDGARIRGQ